LDHKEKYLSAISLPAGRQVRLRGEPGFERDTCQLTGKNFNFKLNPMDILAWISSLGNITYWKYTINNFSGLWHNLCTNSSES